MSDNYGALSGAKWIGRNAIISNPMSLDRFIYSLSYKILFGDTAEIVFAARNKDNYISVEMNHSDKTLSVYYVCDNAWGNKKPSKALCGSFSICDMYEKNSVEIRVENQVMTLIHNGNAIIDNADILPEHMPFTPYNKRLMLVGFRQIGNAAEFSDITIGEAESVSVSMSVLSSLGTVSDNAVTVDNAFELTSVEPCIGLRRSVEIKPGLKKAVLYASARGFYNAYINGKKIGNRYFAPGFTDYRLRITYQKYDVSNMLNEGDNEISAVIGSGYYSGFAGFNGYANVYGKENSFIAALKLEYENGEEKYIYTDESWEASTRSPVVFADCLQGEYYDARITTEYKACDIIEQPQKPVPTNGRRDDLEFSMEEDAIYGSHEVMRLCGKCISKNNSRIIFDMGQNMVGTVEIILSGTRGNGVKLRYGEICASDGEVYVSNLRSAANTDVYILKGDGKERYVPNLVFHGFRYVEVSGNGSDLKDIEVISVTGIVIADVDKLMGGFTCSNELINKLYSNIIWGQRGNFLLVPTDCPQRNERMGWTGDAQVFVRTAAYNMYIYDFMRKWLKDLREGQIMYNRNGSVPDIAPLCGDNRGGCGGWADAAVIVPWELYMAYGKKEILEENYDMMRAWVEFQNSEENRYNGLRTVRGEECPEQSDLSSIPYIQAQQRRGDHVAYDNSTPFILSATAYAVYTAELMSKTAEVLGYTEDAKKYSILHDKIKQAFCEAWVRDDGTLAYWGEMSMDNVNDIYFSDTPGSEHHPSQTAYALAIDFGIIDIKKYPRAAQCYKRTFDVCGGRIFAGFLGVSHLVPALVKCGYIEEAFRLVEQEECPGWLYSVKNGATTIWERWNSYDAKTDTIADPSMNSFNHYTYGAIGEWFYSDILGIRPIKAGYSEVELKPLYGGTLTNASGYHITPYGRIDAAWKIEDDRFIYECNIPEGIKARLVMPDGSHYNVTGKKRYEISIVKNN